MAEANSTVAYRDLTTLGYPGYRVGDDGSVWSRWKKGGMPGRRGAVRQLTDEWRRLSESANAKRYKRINLHYRKTKYVGHVVLEAFVGARPTGMVACHNDGNPENNALVNLRWDTQAGNEADKNKHGTRLRGENHPLAKLTPETVKAIRAEYVAGRNGYIRLSKKYGVSTWTVERIVKRISWAHI